MHATTRLVPGLGPDGNLSYGELYDYGGAYSPYNQLTDRHEKIFRWLFEIGAKEQDDLPRQCDLT